MRFDLLDLHLFIAAMPEVAARRCAKSMRIGLARLRDPGPTASS